MTELAAPRYQAHEFAERAGVTVRTLHHYDRLGLLKPSGYTEAGFRLYAEQDLARLENIVALKFVGLPLKQIRDILDRDALDVSTTLRLQRKSLEEKRRHLDRAIQVIAQAESAATAGGAPDWATFKNIIEVIEMQQNPDFVKKYYTEEQLKELAERGTPDVRAKGERDWADLIREVEAAAAAGENPAGPHGQALVSRYQELIEAFTGGNPGIKQNLEKFYADQANWPADVKKPFSDAADAFMAKARAAAKK